MWPTGLRTKKPKQVTKSEKTSSPKQDQKDGKRRSPAKGGRSLTTQLGQRDCKHHSGTKSLRLATRGIFRAPLQETALASPCPGRVGSGKRLKGLSARTSECTLAAQKFLYLGWSLHKNTFVQLLFLRFNQCSAYHSFWLPDHSIFINGRKLKSG